MSEGGKRTEINYFSGTGNSCFFSTPLFLAVC